jgi:hypothetical protein
MPSTSATTRRAGLARLAAAIAAAAASPALASSSPHGCGLPPLAAIQIDYDEFASTYDELDDGSLSKALGFQELRCGGGGGGLAAADDGLLRCQAGAGGGGAPAPCR